MKTDTAIQEASLWCHEGSHDKVYFASIEQDGGGFVVNFAYGRRGNTLQTGSKTQDGPVGIAEAQAIFQKLVASKLNKGYQYTEKPCAATGTHVSRMILKHGDDPLVQSIVRSGGDGTTFPLPQLLNPIDLGQAATFINSVAWGAQEKFDGKRILLTKSGTAIVASNRTGKACDVSAEIIEALEDHCANFVLDGEAIGNYYHAFDLLEFNGEDLRGLPYGERYDRISSAFSYLDGTPVVNVAPLAVGTEQKQAMLDSIKAEGKEGIVFKKLSAPYKPGRPNSGGDQLKLKMWESCSCLVDKVNTQRSVALVLFDHGVSVPVGNVTIHPNKDVPKAGDVVEVKYLYAYRGGSLYQPQYIGVRDDLTIAECKMSQLKYKAE